MAMLKTEARKNRRRGDTVFTGGVIPFFPHAAEIRKVIYTTNAIESLNMPLRKVTKARG
jgi:hypothetical protein